jgi:hypothetical protein
LLAAIASHVLENGGWTMNQEDLQAFRDKIPYLRATGGEAALLAADLFEALVLHIDEQSNQTSKLEAMLIEAKAEAYYNRAYGDVIREHVSECWHMPEFSTLSIDYPEEAKKYRDEATLELALEAPAWKHIGPDEQKAIQDAIYSLNHDALVCAMPDVAKSLQHSVDVLRKLLEGNA